MLKEEGSTPQDWDQWEGSHGVVCLHEDVPKLHFALAMG